MVGSKGESKNGGLSFQPNASLLTIAMSHWKPLSLRMPDHIIGLFEEQVVQLQMLEAHIRDIFCEVGRSIEPS